MGDNQKLSLSMGVIVVITVFDLMIRVLKRLLPFSGKTRVALRNYIRTSTPVQLHEFVMMGGLFFKILARRLINY